MHRVAVLLLGLLVLPSVAAQGDTGSDVNATTPDEPPVPDGRILHWFDNPFPDPMNGPWGSFLLEVAIYAVLAIVAMVVIGPLLKRASARIPGDIDDHIVAILRKPGFALLLIIGVKDSLRLLTLSERTTTVVESIWTALLVIAATYVVMRLWNEVILSIGKKVSQESESELDDKLYPLFAKVGNVVIVVAGFFFLLGAFNIDLTVFAAGGAVLSLVVAFAAQDTLGNFFAGVFILLDQPFREGDRIEIKEENTWGDVVEIGLRTTRIRTRDNRMVIVPNALIGSNPVINHSFPSSDYRLGVDVGVAYGSDVEKVKEALMAAAASVEGVEKEKRIEALFRKFGESALEFHVRAWFPHYLDARRYEDKLNVAIERHLREAGIEIPFPQRVVHLRDGK